MEGTNGDVEGLTTRLLIENQFYESMSPFHYNHIEAGIVSGSHSISNVELYTSLADYEFLL
jgi:hypothetical protein